MDLFILAMLFAVGVNALRLIAQRKRIALLGSYLGKYQIEKLMETLTDGYLRALGEQDSARREQIWQLLETTEASLAQQFTAFVGDFAKVSSEQTRVSQFALAFPFAEQLFPSASFDARKLFAIHAKGLAAAAQNERQLSPRDKAFTMMAELFLMQHSCHWFCKSKAVASARLVLRHQTAHEQVVKSVAPDTQQAYRALTGA
ncbi:hypothetical protein [Rhodoferax sp. PAMC 29310]|uniref:hypothetical protein n=1 Tax=Rhodoferax sp. PAMC 29310 TaxID=2822760 RepID=UPI001B328DB9|nr:hypothetical protein [Rhodoferax sp. PAMC 29310]